MNQYIDGFVIPVPKDKIEAYKRSAIKAAEIWLEHCALEYRECLGDDLEAGKQIPFPRLADVREDETVIFAYAVYASKEMRDKANQKIMSDRRIEALGAEVEKIFDCSRMAFGGFQSLVYQEAEKS